jgi:enoyl-CoA hydratase/carnithine racemase
VALAGDAGLRAAVLAGEGDNAFIGGADIAEMAELDAVTARAFISRLHGACEAIRNLPVPVIARLQGWTLGAGLEVAAACDLRVAAQNARFGMPEVRVGIPSVIEAALLPQLIGWGRTRRLLLTGAIIDAAAALAWGLVEEVVQPQRLDIAIDEVLADICAGGPQAIRLQKQLIRQWEELAPRAAIARGIDCFAEAWRTTEPTAAMRAFLRRRRG